MSGVTCRVSGVTCHVSGVTCHVAGVICHVSGVTCHVSGVTCHVSGVTYHVSCVTYHVSCVTCHLSGEPNLTGQEAAKWINGKLGLGKEEGYSTSKWSSNKKIPHTGDKAFLDRCG